METSRKKSRAFIITFIIVLILLIAGYFLFVNKGVFGTKGSTSSNKDFESLATTEGQTGLDKIDSGSKSGSIADFIASLFRKDNTTDSNSNSNTNNNNTNSDNSGNSNSTNSEMNTNSTRDSGSNFKTGSNTNDRENFDGSNYSNNPYKRPGSIPTPGDYNYNGSDYENTQEYKYTNNYQCSNGANNYPTCTTKDNKCLNGATNPPTCAIANEEINKCRITDENPLTFTPEEKVKLEELLRQFYLISSNLRTDDDISTIYNDIDQQKLFISQIDNLTQQCYAQIDQKGLMYSGFGWVRHGNPWYSEANTGTYPYTQQSADRGYLDESRLTDIGYSCKDVSGYYYGTIEKTDFKIGGTRFVGEIGTSCDEYNKFEGYNVCGNQSFDTKITGGYHPMDVLLQAGCKWKDGVNFQDTERLLNIW